jgi:uncharacterized protein (TIGR02145 family)
LGGKDVAGDKLKAATDWSFCDAYKPKNSNTNGFSAFPDGTISSYGYSEYSSTAGYWWSSSEDENGKKWIVLRCGDGKASVGSTDKNGGNSVRCIKD